MSGLYFAHSGLRYLVLLIGVAGLLYYAYGMFARRPFDRAANGLRVGFVALLDVQVVLGLILVAMGIWYPALAGHLLMMIVALLIAHTASIMAKRAETDVRRHQVMFFGLLITLVLVAGGILAIGRTLLGTARPTLLP